MTRDPPCESFYPTLSDEEIRRHIKLLKELLSKRSESKTFSVRIGRLEGAESIKEKIENMKINIKDFLS